MVRQRRVIGATNRPDGLLQHLQLGVCERRHVVAERICAGLFRTGLVRRNQRLDLRVHKARHREPIVVIHETVEKRAEFGFRDSVLRADHRSAHKLGRESGDVHRFDESNRVVDIRAEKEHIRIDSLQIFHVRREVSC